MIEEEANVRHPVRDHSVPPRSLLLVGFTSPARQLGCQDLGVIEGRDHIPVAAEVSTNERGRPSVPAAGMREDDQRKGSGLGCGVADSHLAPRCVAWWDREGVPGSRRNIMAGVLRGGGIPDLTREQAGS